LPESTPARARIRKAYLRKLMYRVHRLAAPRGRTGVGTSTDEGPLGRKWSNRISVPNVPFTLLSAVQAGSAEWQGRVDMRPTRGAARGHEPPFKCGVARTFKGRLHPVTGHPIVKDERSVVGHCRLLFVEGYVRSLTLTNRASPRPKDRSSSPLPRYEGLPCFIKTRAAKPPGSP
jgi:hypothetical protein